MRICVTFCCWRLRSPHSLSVVTVCPHVPPLASTELLVLSRCPLLACGKKSLLSLGMLSPKTAAVPLWGSTPSLLLWLTETRPLTFVWTLPTSNQLVLVFDISWESHQEALIVLFSFLFLKISITFSGSLSTFCWLCVVHPLPRPPAHVVGTSLMCLTLGSQNSAAFLSKEKEKSSGTGIFFSQSNAFPCLKVGTYTVY